MSEGEFEKWACVLRLITGEYGAENSVEELK